MGSIIFICGGSGGLLIGGEAADNALILGVNTAASNAFVLSFDCGGDAITAFPKDGDWPGVKEADSTFNFLFDISALMWLPSWPGDAGFLDGEMLLVSWLKIHPLS